MTDRLEIATEEEARAQANVILRNTIDFQMATMKGDETHPSLPMIIIDKAHAHRAFVQRTPWLAPGQYGTRYSVRWQMGIPTGHISFHVVFSNDETEERNEFWLVICPLQMRVLNQQLVAFGNIAKEITKTYGKAVVDTPVAIMSEQAWHRMEGHPFPDMIQTPQQQAWLENNMVLVERCDFKMYCHYFEMWDALKRLPITESVVDYVSHFPCRYCEISIKVLRTQDRILSREETKKFFDQYPSLKELMDSVFEKHQTILEKKVMERSKQMEKGEY